MKKIPSLFKRGPDGLSINEVNPECRWVLDGEGIATAKLDGTACAVINGRLYKRYDNSKRKGDIRVQTTAPLPEWIHCGCPTERGAHIYWVPVGYKDYYHQIGWAWAQGDLEDGTYELVGPGVQDNKHNYPHNMLLMHGCFSFPNISLRTFEEVREFVSELVSSEGIVWYHPDGRMAKITKAKFGIPW